MSAASISRKPPTKGTIQGMSEKYTHRKTLHATRCCQVWHHCLRQQACLNPQQHGIMANSLQFMAKTIPHLATGNLILKSSIKHIKYNVLPSLLETVAQIGLNRQRPTTGRSCS